MTKHILVNNHGNKTKYEISACVILDTLNLSSL